MENSETELRLTAPSQEVGAILLEPRNAWAMLVFGHGASVGIRHRSMVDSCSALAEQGIATLRYHFPYMERGGGFPDSKPILLGTVRAAAELAHSKCPKLPLFLGGRSMGGRMSSMAQSESPVTGALGLVFYGFPLHPAGKPSTERAEHLSQVKIPMLFLQGSKDTLAEPELIASTVAGLDTLAELHVYDGADHSFKMPKSKLPLGKTAEQVLAADTADWMRARL